ncbi:MAG: Ger(x)C family spore germination protein [Clostridia bacterium]|nr:Ger(x)C family spore germination protein [Clostridia bacterium]
MKIIKKLILFILCLLPAVFFCGCQNYSEIEDSYIVSAIGVDFGENKKYLVTAEVVGMAQGGEGTTPAPGTLSAEGDTVFGAVHEISTAAAKELFLSQVSTIIISEEVAREGILEILDLVVRDVELRITNDVVVAKDCKAYHLLESPSMGEEIKAFAIRDILQSGEENTSLSPEVKVYELINTINSPGISAYLPAFSRIQAEEKHSLSLSGTAVFKDDKLVDFLGEEDSKIMTMLQGKTKQTVISVKKGDTGTGHISPLVFNCDTKLKPEETKEGIKMSIHLDLELGINELTGKEDIIDAQKRQMLLKDIEQEIKQKAYNLIRYQQMGSGTDIFGFGNKIYKNHSKLWKKIKGTDYFQNLIPDINVTVKLRSTGFINKSPATYHEGSNVK